jgi:hypothetical protein
LTSLEGAPQEVGGDFICNNNPELTSLKGSPRKVGGGFSCILNPHVISLEGAPQAQSYLFDRDRIDPREVELHDVDLKIFREWLASGMKIDEFLRTTGSKYRGRLTGKKFGI